MDLFEETLDKIDAAVKAGLEKTEFTIKALPGTSESRN
jgi:hypothetical protein